MYIPPTAAVNECVVTKPCKNGATCVDLKDGYRCLCIPGFTGKDCEQGNAIKEQRLKTYLHVSNQQQMRKWTKRYLDTVNGYFKSPLSMPNYASYVTKDNTFFSRR